MQDPETWHKSSYTNLPEREKCTQGMLKSASYSCNVIYILIITNPATKHECNMLVLKRNAKLGVRFLMAMNIPRKLKK